MKFPRNARIFRGLLDVAPFAIVFFLLLIFLFLASLLYTPGVRLELPTADGLPGTDRPTISVAIDTSGRYYFKNQLIESNELRGELRQAVSNSPEPLVLVVHEDRRVTAEQLIQLMLLARQAGISNGLLATLPHQLNAPSHSQP